MNKNNGFTLVELIVTIALLATLSVVVGLSVSNMFNNQTDKQYEDYKKDLENAACVYAEHNDLNATVCATNNEACTIKFSALISAGLISKNLTNPNTGKKVAEDTNSFVKIRWLDKEKKCEYKEA